MTPYGKEWSAREDAAAEWWAWTHADAWDRQLWEYGYAELPDLDEIDEATRRAALVAESRWAHKMPGYDVPSVLWDGCEGTWARPPDVKARAQVRVAMPYMLSRWANRRKARRGVGR